VTPPLTFTAAETAAARGLIELAREEDLASIGDITTAALVPTDRVGTVTIGARQSGIIAGLPVIAFVRDEFAARFRIDLQAADGDSVSANDIVARLQGKLSDLLICERTILNLLSYLSGIATTTRRFVDAVAGLPTGVYDTRKTLPGYRALAKYAVRAGGGRNHRIGLYDQVLIKDNHLAGWLAAHPEESPSAALLLAVERAAERQPERVIEVEVDSLDQLRAVLPGPVQIVLLDNMTPPQLREAVEIRNAVAPQVELEASGGVSLQTIRAIAETGVERISVGALTHSPTILDLGFDWLE
jgi:nicotinate-nucleotide pyrophosphorylase (carboxylating)